MKGKLFSMIVSTILTTTLLCSCGGVTDMKNNPETTPENPYVLWTATDIHYLSPELTDYGPLFTDVVEAGDSKITEDSPAVLEDFLARARSEKPRALVLTGDLTFNGELVSLQEIAAMLHDFTEETSIPVLVIPGNHDINSYRAYRYQGDAAYYAENISADKFREVCREFGPDGALSVDENSFSYMYPLAGDLRLLALDANSDGATGRVKEETLVWAEEQLKQAQKDGATVITATHQSVLPQDKVLVFGFIISNHDDISALFRKYGVTLNLSGHVHLQHQTEEDGLTDIATGSLTVAALRYGIVTLTGGGDFTYEMASAGTDELREKAEERFHEHDRPRFEETLSEVEPPLSAEDKAEMLDFALQSNYLYFTGQLTADFVREHEEALKKWREAVPDSRLLRYWESAPAE